MEEFYTPPPFKVCDCADLTEVGKERYKCACPKCHGAGRVPIWYTIQKWEKLTGRKAPDDMVVWYFISPCIDNDFKCKFKLGTVAEYKLWSEEDGSSFSIVATEASHPPVEYNVRNILEDEMSFRNDWEKITEEECLHTHKTICGTDFKYFNIEYVKWLEDKLQHQSSNSDYVKCIKCEERQLNNPEYDYCPNCGRHFA